MLLLRMLSLLIPLLMALAVPASADEAELRTIIAKFASAKNFSATQSVVRELAVTGDPVVEKPLMALSNGDLVVRDADRAVFIGKETGTTVKLLDPLTADVAGGVSKSEVSKVKVNNTLRRMIRDLVGALTLSSADPVVRIAAADTMFKTPSADGIEPLDAAIAREEVSSVKLNLEQARASAVLVSDLPNDQKLAAIELIGTMGSREAASLLIAYEALSEGAMKDAAMAAITKINETLAMWAVAQNVWYGMSLGSVLLLAAIGLAITFGVMGVINMAHGEMVMLGAYTTFVVQEVIRSSFPALFDSSLAIALPLAFLVAGGVGLAIERGIIRFLYGRPLETLLATWGVSLILQQSVRIIFGPTNREVGNPSWMSGAFDVGQMSVTWALGALFVAVTLFLPKGIVGMWDVWKAGRRESKAAAVQDAKAAGKLSQTEPITSGKWSGPISDAEPQPAE